MKTSMFVAFLVSLLTGCIAAPGMQMDNWSSARDIKRILITADLIHKQQVDEGAASTQPIMPEGLRSDTEYHYRIGPHDILSVVVLEHPDLSMFAGRSGNTEATGYLVSEDGTIFLPYIGTVEVAGMTAVEVREKLTKMFEQMIVDPQVDVKVAAYRSKKAYVVGEVKQPGSLPITDVPLTVIEAVYRAGGGLTSDADSVNVTLTRDGENYDIDLSKGEIIQNYLLKDGDLLRIPVRSEQKMFVLGEVLKPSSFVMTNGKMSLTEAIGDAGGVDPITSNPAHIYVIRGNGDQSEIYLLNAKSPDALILGDQFQLKPHDVVFVETAAVTRWNRVIEQIVPSSRIYGTASRTGLLK